VLLVFGVGVLLLILFANGLSTQTTGRSITNDPSRHPALSRSRPLLTADGDRLRSPQPAPRRRIALTFDDGPDPKWTPRVVAMLKRMRVPATFFVLGSQVVRHPEIVRAVHESGFQIGNHTFSHADLAGIAGWQRDLQVELTETAIAAAAGVRPRLLRPPYSSTTDAITTEQARDLTPLAKRGHVIALSELDGRDWQRPGVEQIIANITPRGAQGGVVLLHDAGGDRGETLSAVRRLVPRLRKRGFRFVTLSELLGVPPSAIEVPATSSERLRGQLLIGALTVARWITAALTLMLIVMGALTLLRLGLAVVLARRHAAAYRRRTPDPAFAPPVSLVVPVFNESVDVEHCVRSLATVEYPDVEVIVVDDGSADGTAQIVEQLGLERVRVVRQANGGKPVALNRGIAEARHDILVMVDGDTMFEPQTLRRLVAPLADEKVGGVSGNTKVANRSGLLGRWQHIEYVVGFNLDRRMYEVLQCMPTVPGAIGAFRRAALADAGGLSRATLAEDTDLTLGIGRAGWRVVYAEDALAWTDAPGSLGDLWRQRYRWAFGTLQAVWKHRAALWQRGEPPAGRRAIPYLLLFQIVLPLLGPLVDIFALYGIIFLDPVKIFEFWLGFTVVQLATAVYAFRLDREPIRDVALLPLQQFVYRQLMYLVVVESVVTAVRGVRLGWLHVARTGHFEAATAAPGAGDNDRAAS
jgi:cellulose synthase/poly-beta-1,6-N-acetylglucosamine synthase-like glycosyltransferase/peptidoglycan/xylan/chitin deacetylase (PgdA/CDA1 family)